LSDRARAADPESVLIVHPVSGVKAGAEEYLRLVAGGLAARGVQVSVALVGRRTEIDDGIAYDLARRSVQTLFVPGVRGLPALRARVATLRPDLLHWNLPEPFSFRGGAWVLPPWGRPSVSTDHLPMLRNRRLWELVRRLANRKLSGLLVCGESSRGDALRHWGSRSPIHVVHNAVEPVPFAERSLAEGEPLRLLFLGRLHEQKDPLFVVAVADALRRRGVDFRLSIAGDGPLSEAVRARVAELDLGGFVEIAGFVSPPWDEYARAHVLLTPARFEGAPLVPLEALSSGLPVLGSDIGPHSDLAAVTPAFRVLPTGDPEPWVDELLQIAADLPSLSRAAHGIIESRSVDSMIDAVLDVYRGVLARG
jgi:glycosyltransferase involved in cell wall biosynthesis